MIELLAIGGDVSLGGSNLGTVQESPVQSAEISLRQRNAKRHPIG